LRTIRGFLKSRSRLRRAQESRLSLVEKIIRQQAVGMFTGMEAVPPQIRRCI
jgi:hypothetical protein